MLRQSDIDPTMFDEALEYLKSVASNNEYSNHLLVSGSSKGSVADLYMSTDEKIVKINHDINNHIAGIK